MNAIREDQLGRAMTWSLAAHGALAVIVLLKSLVFPGEPVMIAPALRVDLVGLPDILKKDLINVSKTLPSAETPAKPMTKVAPAETAPKADEMVLHPTKTDRSKKLDSALARIRALERLKDKTEDEKEDEPVVIKGNTLSKGSSLSGAARENAQAGYYDLIREALVEFWSLPPWLARQKNSAQIQIRIDPAGNVLSAKFLKKSDNAQFNEAILATVKQAQPFPRPPRDLASSLADNGVVVGFPL